MVSRILGFSGMRNIGASRQRLGTTDYVAIWIRNIELDVTVKHAFWPALESRMLAHGLGEL
jgi:hypothetical protein